MFLIWKLQDAAVNTSRFTENVSFDTIQLKEGMHENDIQPTENTLL